MLAKLPKQIKISKTHKIAFMNRITKKIKTLTKQERHK